MSPLPEVSVSVMNTAPLAALFKEVALAQEFSIIISASAAPNLSAKETAVMTRTATIQCFIEPFPWDVLAPYLPIKIKEEQSSMTKFHGQHTNVNAESHHRLIPLVLEIVSKQKFFVSGNGEPNVLTQLIV